MSDEMRVTLRDSAGETLAFGVVDAGNGYDGTPILTWRGRYFTASGELTPEGFCVYIERRLRLVDAAPGWDSAEVSSATKEKP